MSVGESINRNNCPPTQRIYHAETRGKCVELQNSLQYMMYTSLDLSFSVDLQDEALKD